MQQSSPETPLPEDNTLNQGQEKRFHLERIPSPQRVTLLTLNTFNEIVAIPLPQVGRLADFQKNPSDENYPLSKEDADKLPLGLNHLNKQLRLLERVLDLIAEDEEVPVSTVAKKETFNLYEVGRIIKKEVKKTEQLSDEDALNKLRNKAKINKEAMADTSQNPARRMGYLFSNTIENTIQQDIASSIGWVELFGAEQFQHIRTEAANEIIKGVEQTKIDASQFKVALEKLLTGTVSLEEGVNVKDGVIQLNKFIPLPDLSQPDGLNTWLNSLDITPFEGSKQKTHEDGTLLSREEQIADTREQVFNFGNNLMQRREAMLKKPGGYMVALQIGRIAEMTSEMIKAHATVRTAQTTFTKVA